MKISELIVNEQHSTCQIQQEAVFQDQRVQTLHPTEKVVQVSPEPISAHLKHRLVQRRLTNQMMRQSNIVKPTADDVRIAKKRAETALKRVDLDYQRKMGRIG